MVEEGSIDVEDTLWDTTEEDTTLQADGLKSCVAHRTRSRTEDLRKINITELMEAYNTTLDDSFEVLDPKAVDSIDLIKAAEPEWSNRENWYEGIKRLNNSMNKTFEIGGIKRQAKMLERHRKRITEMAKENEEMEQSQTGIDKNLEKELEEVKKVTFVVERSETSTAMQEVINALETLIELKL